MICEVPDKAVMLGDDGNDPSFPGFHFLDIAQHFIIHLLVGGDEHHGHIVVDEGDGAMLHLSGRITFGMDVGYFLELQRSFQGDREIIPSSEVKEIP